MKKLLPLAVAAAGLALAGPANAADMRAPVYKAKAPPPVVTPIYNWAGFYIGANIGGLWTHKQWSEFCTAFILADCVAGALFAPPTAITSRPDPSGILGGGQVGYNWQSGPWVFGVEGQWSWTNADHCGVFTRGGVPFTFGGSTFSACTDMAWVGTLAGRVGYAWDRALLYGKAGGAFDRDSHWMTGTGFGIITRANVGDSRTGWILGVGLEYGITPNWSAKVEYNHMDFGSERVLFHYVPAVKGGFSRFDIEQGVDLVIIGINYRFGTYAFVVPPR